MNTYPICLVARGSGELVSRFDLSPVCAVSRCRNGDDRVCGIVCSTLNEKVVLEEPEEVVTGGFTAAPQPQDVHQWQVSLNPFQSLGQADVGEREQDCIYLRSLLSPCEWMHIRGNANRIRVPSLVSLDSNASSAFFRQVQIHLAAQTIDNFPDYLACRARWREDRPAQEAWVRSMFPECHERLEFQVKFYHDRDSRLENLATNLDVEAGQLLGCQWGPQESPNYGALLLLERLPTSSDRWNALMIGTGAELPPSGAILRQQACWSPPRTYLSLGESRSIDALRRDRRLKWIEKPIAEVL